MPRTDLTAQQISLNGVIPTYTAAITDGHMFINNERQFIHVKNAGAGSTVVTIVTPVTVGGRAVSDDTVTIAAATDQMIGPFPAPTHSNTGVDAGKVYVNYSVLTSVTCAVLTL